MKKKPLKKLKPLQEFYNYDNFTLLNSKAEVLSKLSQEESTVDQSSVDVLSKVRVMTNRTQLHDSEASKILPSFGQSSSTEAFQSSNSLKAPGSIEDQPMFEKLSTSSTPEHQVKDVFDCQGDDSSCISKEDEAMISGDHSNGADHKNVTSSVASISSSCPDGLEKSLIGKSITNGSSVDHMSVEEGDNNSMRPHSSDELNFNSPIATEQKPHLQNQNILHGDESEELVDVRVCDICGDAGREMLLALCSKCSDGAEHIYCMTPKMDKVPESDWLCEECALLQEPKRHQLAVVERSESSDNNLELSCSKVPSQGSPSMDTAIKQVGKPTKVHLSKSSVLPDKKLEIDASVKTKKRSVDQIVQSPKISCSERQTRLSQVSSLKNVKKRNKSADQVSSFVDLSAKKVVKQAGSSCHRSLKPEQQCCGDSLNSLEVQCSRKDIRHRSSSKENAACDMRKKHPDKIVLRSLSCADVGSIPLDVLNTQSSAPTVQATKCGSGKNSSEKQSKEIKASQLRQTSSVSKIVKGGNSSRKKVDKKTIHVNGKTNVKPIGSLANKRRKIMNTLGAGSVEKKKSQSHSSYMLISPDVNGDSDQRDLKAIPTTDPADTENRDLSAIPAVPESTCIWKGTFKLDISGILPSDCSGIQAHLSSHASSRVDELVINFSTELQFMVVPRMLTWPIQFQKNQPTEQDIALYFFAQDFLSYQRSYRKLLEVLTSKDLALEANFGGFQLLVFPSSLLPAKSKCWNSLPYLWGVFRARKHDDSHFLNSSILPLNQRLGTPVTCGSESKIVSPVNGSAFPSHTPQKSMEGMKSVDPVVLQSSASLKSRDQSSEHEVPSLQNNTLQEHHVPAGTMFCDGWRFKGYERGVLSGELQEGKKFYDEDVKSDVDIFGCGKPKTPIELCSGGVSGSSLSLDSGPSGLSDSGWCAKSADEEPYENLGSYNNAINLDLCLGNRSEDVDLDLALGFPSRSAYQPKDYLKNRSNQDEDASLMLSLGMPFSNR